MEDTKKEPTQGLKEQFENKFVNCGYPYDLASENDATEVLAWIESKIKEAKIINADDYLIELSDEQYEVLTEEELNKVYDSADEFDGFTGIRVVGKIKTLGEK